MRKLAGALLDAEIQISCHAQDYSYRGEQDIVPSILLSCGSMAAPVATAATGGEMYVYVPTGSAMLLPNYGTILRAAQQAEELPEWLISDN